MRPYRCVPACALAALSTFVLPARADDAPPAPSQSTEESPQVTQARDAFRNGSTLAKNRQWADALAAFRESERLMPHPVTRYNIALCEHALGRYTHSYRIFSALLEAPAGSSGALSADLEAQARLYRAEAEQRTARVKVSLAQNDLSLRVDGMPLSALRDSSNSVVFVVAEDASASKEPLPRAFDLWLDPGAHSLIASRRDGRSVSENHVFGLGSSTSLTFSVAEETRPPPVAPTTPTPAQPASSGDTTRLGPPDRTLSFIAFGAAGAGLVAAGVFTGLALHAKSGLDDDPYCHDKICPDQASYRDRQARIRTFADVATAGLALGVLGAAAGTYFWIVAEPSRDRSNRDMTTRVEGWIGFGSAGLAATF